MALLGNARFSYEVSGADWGRLPEGWGYKEATAVAVDSKDNAYVFNRGGPPGDSPRQGGQFPSVVR